MEILVKYFAACVTVHICGVQPVAENVILPVRDVGDVFACTKTVTLPSPLPELVEPVNHPTLADTDHAVFDVTLILFPLAVAGTFIVFGVIDSEKACILKVIV